MANEDDLYKVITEELTNGGHLNRLQGEVRSKVLQILGQHWGVSLSASSSTPEQPLQVLLLNQAIKEYLEWMGYTYTSSVFTNESGTSQKTSDISSLKSELGLHKQNGSQNNNLPILVSVFSAILNT